MRFPWLQIDADVIEAKASDLGTLIGLSRRETIGLLVDLWSWCLTRTPKDSPPDGIVRDSRTGTGAVPLLERAGSWAGPEGRLAAALEDVGLIERIPDGIRFRGIGRYKATWEKNRRRKGSEPEPEKNRSGSVGDSSRKTQTQTQTQTTTTSSAPADAVSEDVDELPDATDDAMPDERPLLTLAPSEPDRPEPKPHAEKPKGPPPEALREVWNRLAPPAGCQRWEAMSKPRERSARLALEACPDLARWEAWLTHELARPFNRGENPSGWKADVDWLLRAKTRDMVADFNPSNASKGTSAPAKPTSFMVL